MSNSPESGEDLAEETIAIPWDSKPREFMALPCEMAILERYATQPGNVRSRKPARLIYLYTLGRSRAEILADLRISEATAVKYFNRWITDGLSGVTRAYHPGVYRSLVDGSADDPTVTRNP